VEALLVVDLDGTIADDRHRMPEGGDFSQFSEEDWTKFYSRENILKDVPISVFAAPALRVCQSSIVYLTGRDRIADPISKEWIRLFGFPDVDLYSRPSGDRRSGAMVKQDLLVNEILPKFFGVVVRAAIDDDEEAQPIYSALGFEVFTPSPALWHSWFLKLVLGVKE